MSVSLAKTSPVHPTQSVAWLVLETVNDSVYAIEIGRGYSRATCVKGTLVDRVKDVNVTDLPDEVIATWCQATGLDGMSQGAHPRQASQRVQNSLTDRPFVLETSDGNFRLSEVSVARWALTEGEILNPPASLRSRHTASLFVHTKAYSQPIPLTSTTCWDCKAQVDVLDENEDGGLLVSRRNGDSRWGYEPCHKSCSAKQQAEMDAWMNSTDGAL